MKGEKGEREGGTGCAIEGQEEEERERESKRGDNWVICIHLHMCVY